VIGSFHAQQTLPHGTDVSDPDFHDKRVIVTGGTQGIGAAIARQFVEAGAKVVVAARTPVDGVRGAQFVQADVATPEGVLSLATTALDFLGGIDVIVNNAGSQSYVPAGVLAMTDDDWLRDLNTNLLSAVRLDRALLPSMIAQRSGVRASEASRTKLAAIRRGEGSDHHLQQRPLERGRPPRDTCECRRTGIHRKRRLEQTPQRACTRSRRRLRYCARTSCRSPEDTSGEARPFGRSRATRSLPRL